MRSRRLLWQLFPSYVIVAVVSILSVTWFAGRSVRNFSLQYNLDVLQARARIAGEQLQPLLARRDVPAIHEICQRLERLSETRFTVIASDGTVLGDSREDYRRMNNHSDRPEVQAAAAGPRGESVRFSATLDQKMIYVAVAIRDGTKLLGFVRTSIPLADSDAAVTSTYGRIALAGLAIALVVAVFSLLFSRRITRPLERLAAGAERFAAGDLNHKLPASDSTEIGALAASMNTMASNLNQRVETILDQKNQERAILEGMEEGVIALNTEGRLITANPAAEALFSFKTADRRGQFLQEIVRNHSLLTRVERMLADGAPFEDEITAHEPDALFLQVRGTELQGQDGARMGALIVFNDITHLRRLERVRRDFVANVSHELKTPITAIKGFVETLLEGALQEPDDAERFLKIVAKHSDRLNAIIEDLLALSRIEQDQERVQLETMRLRPVVAQAVDTCRHLAQARGIEVLMEIEDDLSHPINAALLEQALVNLIDNGIKYSDEGGRVKVSAAARKGGVVITVEDQGVGIDGQHLPRLFERFYRTDNARSRAMGGTGLGLAIVKHIALAQGGRVEVQSEIGKGSIFSIYL